MQDQCPHVLVILLFLILCFHGLTHLRPIKLPAPPASETLLSTELWDFCALGVFREEIETTGDSFLKFGLAIKISVLGGSIP